MTGAARADDPLSAIEWLERRPAQVVVTPPDLPGIIDEPPIADSISTPQVTVSALGTPNRGAAGLLPSSVTGLPASLWRGSDPTVLAQLLSRLSVDAHPAMQSLLYTLLLAEANAPQTARDGAFLQTRLSILLDLGAIDPAAALIARADPATPVLFGVHFELSVLNGTEDRACTLLRAKPALSSDLAIRVFCDARAGAWDTAALTLSTGDAIGAITPLDTDLLERFLDPELFEGRPLPQVPARPTALQFKLFEAIGERFAHRKPAARLAATDLGGDAGWKAQADAAERLARAGAISENRLLGIYTSRIPSASGGIWDRIEAIQRMETAIRSGDPVAVAKQSARAWTQMQDAGLAVPFAALFGESLLRFPPVGSDPDLLTRIALLSPAYEDAAKRETKDALLTLARHVARGDIPSGAKPTSLGMKSPRRGCRLFRSTRPRQPDPPGAGRPPRRGHSARHGACHFRGQRRSCSP